MFIWDSNNLIKSKKKNHEFYFSTNTILKKNWIKKQLKKLKDQKIKNKYIKFDG